MVEITNGFKIGVVKFIGETEFSPGDWIGVALERQYGESNAMLLYIPFISYLLVQASTMGQ